MAELAVLDECPWLAETPEERRYVTKRVIEKADAFEREQEELEWNRLAESARALQQIPETVRPPAFRRTENSQVRRKQS